MNQPTRHLTLRCLGLLACVVLAACTSDETETTGGCPKSGYEGAAFFSQYYEDYILSYVFEDLETGTYVDVGANHPQHATVTRYFYEKGWTGINIDANPQFEMIYSRRRPRDTNLFVGIAEEPGVLKLFKVSDAPGLDRFALSGLSTFDPEIAEKHRRDGFEVETLDVPVERLDKVLAEHGVTEFTFLNVDVEGFERNVLASIDFDATRPRVVIVEATVPRTSIPAYESWESILTDNGYRFALTDGLNRYYAHSDHAHLIPRFEYVGGCVHASLERQARERSSSRVRPSAEVGHS